MTEHTHNQHCEPFREVISARIDGEASKVEIIALKSHLLKCQECSEYESDIKAIHNALEGSHNPIADVDLIWQNILQDIHTTDKDSGLSAGKYRFGGKRKWLAGMGLVACLIVGIAIGSLTMLSPSSNQYLPVVSETLRDFESYRLLGKPLDVNQKDTPDMLQWMAAELEFQLPEKVYPPQGYRVSGGRLCSFLNRKLAFFQYESDTDAVAMYVMKSHGLELPAIGSYQTSTTNSGISTVTWTRDDLVYVIVSELPVKQAIQFALQT